jgi:hypothetical protein
MFLSDMVCLTHKIYDRLAKPEKAIESHFQNAEVCADDSENCGEHLEHLDCFSGGSWPQA